MRLETVSWHNNSIRIIDQTKLPGKLEYLYIKDKAQLWKAIKLLKVRGAPALGAAAGLGVYLGIKDLHTEDSSKLADKLDKVARYIASSRPTARNLFWAVERVCSVAVRNRNKPIEQIKRLILEQALSIIKEDRISCRKMAEYGQTFIKKNDTILTICNTGILATIDYGTALGVIYRAHEKGKKIKVFACETRPLLQGARLTCWELKRKGIDATLICDSMAATLMKQGKIDKVIAGADRIALNGDTANKIGTYSLAALSYYHKIPFYIVAPASTFDLNIKTGKQIPIEERNGKEVTDLFFKKPIAPAGIKVYNPAFDVTPNKLMSAIITDKGVIKKPFVESIKRIFRDC